MVSKELILKLAKLAHLNVDAKELPELSERLGAIFDYMKELDAVNVEGVEAMSHVLGANNVFREDIIQESLPVEDLKAIAPDTSGRFIRVPIIIDQE